MAERAGPMPPIVITDRHNTLPRIEDGSTRRDSHKLGTPNREREHATNYPNAEPDLTVWDGGASRRFAAR